MEYYLHLAVITNIYLILCIGFNFVFGRGLLFNLAHASLFAIGAYSAALFTTELNFAPTYMFFLSPLITATFALLIGFISIRLAGDYFAIGSLAFASLVSALLINWRTVTHGVLGIPGIPRPGYLDSNLHFFYFTGVLALLALASFYFLLKTPFARQLSSQASLPHVAEALGIRSFTVRIISFVVAAVYAGLAGALYSYYISYIDPSSFSISEMVFVLTAIIVGRPGSFWGMTAATIFLVLLPEPLRFLDLPSSVLGPLRQLLYATILLALTYFNRARIFPYERQV